MSEIQTAAPEAAPATAVPAAASASTAGSTSTASTTDRPSFGEALDVFNSVQEANGKPPRGTPPVQATTVPEVPIGTVPPVAPVVAKPAGPIPLEVHRQTLENARQKTRLEVEQEYQRKYGDLDRMERGAAWITRAERDPLGLVTDLFQSAAQNPELAAQLRSLAGRTLGGRGVAQPDQSAAATEPGPDFQDGQGNQFYSSKALRAREDWLMSRMEASILEKVGPQLAQVETVTQNEQARQQQVAQAQWRDTTLAKARALPYFKEHEAEIKHVYLALPPTDNHPANEAAALRDAYDQVVLPKLSQLEHDRTVATFTQRASASTLNPSSTGTPGGVPANVSAAKGGSMANALRWAEGQVSGGRP